MTTESLELREVPEGAACPQGHGCCYCNRERIRQQDAEGMKDAAGPILVFMGLWLGGTVLLMSFVPAWVGGIPSPGWTLALSVGLLQTLTLGGLAQIWVRRREKRRRKFAA